jgi:hypothetical protein
VAIVDNGGWFPDDSLHIDYSWFLMDGMKLLGTDAVGLGDRDLRFGLAYLRAQLKRTQLPVVCANLIDKKTKTTAFSPYLIKPIGTVKVGFFGLMSDKVDLGPARDSLAVQEPQAVARRTIDEMRKKGATVVVLLSQLGKVESEDLVTAIDGVDLVVVGRNVPLLQKGRLIKSTVACYGGEQGQYMGRTVLTLNAQKKVTTGDNETFVLGPEVGEHPDIAQIVKEFEDKFNEKLRKVQMEQSAQQAATAGTDSPDRFVGSEVCQRCHVSETEQWKTTKHAHAWQTLVDNKKDATPDCVPCHVVGYRKPGGFTDGSATPKMTNVGCENCHGMGSQHEAFATAPRKITEQTCQQCHTSTTSPTFNYAVYRPHIEHKFTGTMPEIPKHESPMLKAATGSH